MKTRSGRAMGIVLAVLLIGLFDPVPATEHSAVDGADRPTLRVVINAAPPYRIIEKEEYTTLVSGIYVDVARELARRSGVEIKFIVVSFIQALSMMESGAADMMLGPNRLVERERYMHFLDPSLPPEPKVLLLHRRTSDVAAQADLVGKRIGVLPGASYGMDFDSDRNFDKVPLRSYLDGMRMVANGYLDGIVVPEQLGDYLGVKVALPLKKATFRIDGRPSHITLSNLSPFLDHRKAFREALEAMRADGSFERILASYK